MDRKCKIVATIGPASQDYDMLEQLIKTGVNVIRLNFSHGNQEEHQAVIERTRDISEKLGLPVGILQDLQGPKLRIGSLKSSMILKEDEIYSLVPQEVYNDDTHNTIPIDIPDLYRSVGKNDLLLFNDGRIRLEVQNSIGGTIIARVRHGGFLSSHLGLNLPNIKLGIPSVTEKDAADLSFGLRMGVDAVAISFVRSADDVIQVRKFIKKIPGDHHPLLISKLEKPEALDHLLDIIEVSDGVMVARGDLGVEMDLEDVPVAQKRIIKTANQMNKLVITATQMLESMIQVSSPTRAEASDVANAIFDGTDMVMLSGETAIGKYPIETVSTMNRIICQSEAAYPEWGFKQVNDNSIIREGIPLVKAARELAHARDVAAIAVFTRSGQTANLMAKIRPQVPILAFTPEEGIYQRLSFLWGVHPHRVPWVNNVEEMFKCVELELISSGMVNSGQKVVLIFGYPVGTKVPPNMTLIHKIE